MPADAKILLVDDDPIMRELAGEKLCAAGYQVETAENGAEALEKLRTAGADLVISDIEMPVMDGFDLTRNIRSDRTIAETPIIVITASDHAEAVDRVFAEGATSFLAKPINWTLFTQAVKFILRASFDQKNLRIARDQAEAGAKFKDALMSVMSHELRTPLNAIIGFGQLLGEQFGARGDMQHKEYAEYIVDGGRRLLNTVSDMLLASDARSGPISITETDTTIAELVDAARQLVTHASGASDAKYAIKLQDPDLEICCDRALMSRALSKLIDNAIKFCPRGVKITIGSALTKNGELAILIKDDGPGINPAILDEISAPFEQSDMSLRRSKEGLGLGLPMTKAIAAAHQAQFRLNSDIGEGARALIVLPAERVRKRDGAAQSAA
ncbi:MAG: response regulator [Pseudomonadota bacterium]